MEGVVDYEMRQLLTNVGRFDRCVTEFIRVTNNRLPSRVFYKYCPELRNQYNPGYTISNTPVFVQLLGSDLHMMAYSAVKAVKLGAPGIDLNFGCPAKSVNRHDGGSVLLREPQRIHYIVKSVRDSLAIEIPVTAKVRIGYENSDLLHEICSGIETAGADEICIHARTKTHGYKPPAYWSKVKPVSQELKIPVIINGEIWNIENAKLAKQQSGCKDIMLGRGALSCPDLSMQITDNKYVPITWLDVLELLQTSFNHTSHKKSKHTGNRIKQWLVYLSREYPQAHYLFKAIKTLKSVECINRALDQHRHALVKNTQV